MENVVADRRASDVDRVEGYGLAALRGHLDGAEGGVHLWADSGYGAVEDSAWFSLALLISHFSVFGDNLIRLLTRQTGIRKGNRI